MRWLLLVALVALVACDSRKLGVLDHEDASVSEDAGAEDAGAEDAGAEGAAPLGAVCAVSSGEAPSCTRRCPSGESCFTQVACGPLRDGGVQCFVPRPPADGDDRCHRNCTRDEDCDASQRCAAVPFSECVDYNGGKPNICVAR